MAQLVRIGATVNQRQSLKENLQDSNEKSKEEGGEDEESEESQKEVKEEILLLALYQNISFVFCFNKIFLFFCL